MKGDKYGEFEALNPFFDIVLKGLKGQVDGAPFFETISNEDTLEFRYEFPGWPKKTRGGKGYMKALAGYGDNIRLHSGDQLVVHRCQDRKVTIIEYQVHGMVLATGARYDNGSSRSSRSITERSYTGSTTWIHSQHGKR